MYKSIGKIVRNRRSGLEDEIERQLRDDGIEYGYECISLSYTKGVRGGFCRSCRGRDVGKRSIYTPDFILSNGVVIEGKGQFTGGDRSKLRAIKDEYPDLDLRIVFQRNNRLNKKSETRYLDWAKKNGIPAVVLKIPSSWLEKELPSTSKSMEIITKAVKSKPSKSSKIGALVSRLRARSNMPAVTKTKVRRYKIS